jgi:hypothetical protein
MRFSEKKLYMLKLGVLVPLLGMMGRLCDYSHSVEMCAPKKDKQE